MTPPTADSPAKRIASIDVMRGIVILLMMMDHVRERFYMHTRTGDPIYDSIEPDLFFTRFLTHFCAPVFIFLAGTSAWLYAHPPNRDARSPSAFLFKRGVVIVMIEIVLYYLVWVDSYPTYLFLQVLFAIGVCMIGLSVASRLNYWLIGALGFLIVLGHNALVPINFTPDQTGHFIWTILHDPGELMQIGPLTVSLSYPVLPWFGVILLGYFAGPLYHHTMSAALRRRRLYLIGAVCLGALAVLRGFNIYGEAVPWETKDTWVRTVMSFLNYTKYPPSLDYILVTLGIALPVLALLESASLENRLLKAIEYFGSVPMFIYVVHLYVLLAAYWVLYAIFGATHGARFGLPSVGWIWVGAGALIVLHYPVARSFAQFKHREKRSKPWLSYF
ncbi:MAG: heparan-alpha-glucosaminide N-acetyltransferase domain-containing protein [Pseudomonadota bacterium]